MQVTADKLGKYELELGSADLSKRLVGATFHQALDRTATLKVTIAASAPELATWTTGNAPLETSLTVGGKGIFRGGLLEVATCGYSRLTLTFVDALQAATRRSASQFVKQQTLEDSLRKIASACGLSARFCGGFSDPLPGFPQGGTTLFGLMAGLADKHGFFFATRSANGQVAFLRAGEAMETATIDFATQAATVTFDQSASASIEKAQFRYFDARSVEAKQTVVSADELYGGLAAFTGGSSFREKRGWKTAGGAVETHFTDRFHFERGPQLLAGQFSKQAMRQEQLTVTGFEVFALPGDKVTVKSAPAAGAQEGTYLVGDTTIEVASVLPRVTLGLIRP